MRVNAGTLSQEDFPSGYILLFENGLALRSPSVLWLGKAQAAEVTRQFEEIVEALKTGSLVYDESFQPETPT